MKSNVTVAIASSDRLRMIKIEILNQNHAVKIASRPKSAEPIEF